MTHPVDPIDHIVQCFEQLTPSSIEQLVSLYEPDARFKDPFNDVRGQPAIQQIFRHMYVSLHEPRFVITGRIVDGSQCFLTWEFRFRFKRFHAQQDQVILGGTHLVLAPDGRISLHRDYWDTAEELYEKLPLVGGLMRWLKKRAND
ncbi:MAG: hypothetical protein RL459_2099 [Pseudomonadota bacterium]|jgi:hypothetical protein